MHTRGISFDGAVYPEVCFLVLQRMFIVHGHCGWHLVPKVCGLFTVQVGPAMDEQVCVRVSIVGPVCLVSVWVVLNCSSHSSLPFTAPNCLSPMTNPQTEDSSRQWTRTFRRQWRWMDLPRKKTWGNSLFLSAIIYLIPPPPPPYQPRNSRRKNLERSAHLAVGRVGVDQDVLPNILVLRRPHQPLLPPMYWLLK